MSDLPPLTVRLISGIGNNLYQIATLYHLSKVNDRKWVAIHPKRDGEIQEIRQFGGHYTPMKLDDLGEMFIQDVFPLVKWADSCEPDWHVIPSYIFGIDAFWDSIGELRDVLKPCERLVGYIQTKYGNLCDNAIGVHLRFTSGSDSFIPETNIPEWVYHILQKHEDDVDRVIVVSNRPHFAKKFMEKYTKKPVTFIEGEPNFVDFFLLSMCKVVVCSNSTFSFWAGALSNAKDIYMHPEYKPAMCRDSIPPNWKTEKELFYRYYMPPI